MYARVTSYRMKPDSITAAEALLNQVKSEIMAMPGMLNFINVIDADGNGYVVAVVESEETSNANQEMVEAMWARFGDFLAEPPQPGGYRVMMNEANG